MVFTGKFRQVIKGIKMSEELVSRKELAFQLYEVLDTESLCERERYSEHNKGTFDAVMETADKIAREKFAPHNLSLIHISEPTRPY